ncbi:MAG: hypothetical protein IPO40_03180 [Fibrobacteres bacterium]|nr:hypothetical protein [Fibrobacterota bacterium]
MSLVRTRSIELARQVPILFRLGLVVAFFCAPAALQAQVQMNVGAGQAYTSIQKAVDACPAAGCKILLTDSLYTLSREVWIEEKNNLSIQPSPQMVALKIRPRIQYVGLGEFAAAGTAANPTDPLRPAGWKKWPNKGTSQRGAGAAGDTGAAANPYSTSGFQNNGYVVVYKSTNILIDGIHIDGRKPITFVNKGIWDDKWDVFFGNVGINLFQSKKVVVRNTEVRNCFAGFYIQNRNVGGAFAAPNPNDLDAKTIIPYSRFGKMGDHLIERNYVHNNWFVVYNEMEWDIGSTIRYNLLDQNYNTQFSQNSDSSSDANNMTGGFMYLKDVRIVPHKIYNNTINGSTMIFANSYFKPGVQHYFYNNLITNFNRQGINARMIGDNRQYLHYYKDFLYNNTFEVGQPDSLYQIQNEQSGQVRDAAVCATVNQTPPCYLTWDKPVPVLQSVKNQWLWNGWMTAQGANYTAMYKGAPYEAYNAQNIDLYHQGGLIKFVKGPAGNTANIDISAQANLWVRKLPYKSTTPGAAGFLVPQWDSAIVDSTVTDKGWASAGNRDMDGSMVDRGAISEAGDGIISPLALKDQFIVTLDKTARTVSFQYCIESNGVASDLTFELTSYYRTIALTKEGPNGDIPTPAFPAPVQLTNTGTKPQGNACGIFKATLPTAPVDSFARFDLVVKGDVDGKPTKSNVGVWVWRQTQYKLDVYFTRSATGTDTVSSVRVGEPVYMRVVGRRTDNNSAIPRIDVLAATPDRNMFLLPADKQVMSGDTIDRNLPGTGAYNVRFTQTGTATVSLSGMVGTLPVPGAGVINVRPGLPEKVIWQNPPDWMYADRTISRDSAATTMDQAPTPITLQVVDKFGNNVDTIANVTLGYLAIDPGILQQGYAATAAGPFTATQAKSDGAGLVSLFHMVQGIQGMKFWGFANVDGKTEIDSALMKVGKPRAQLFFVPASKIDTFITVAMPVHLILSKNGTVPDATDSWAGATVALKSSSGTKFYASATSTTPLDSATLVGGVLDLWVRSEVLISNDTLKASHPWIGNGVPAVFAPVTFRLPPKPDAPEPAMGLFLDKNCDGLADSAVIAFKPLGGAVRVAVLDTSKVRLSRVVFRLGTDTISLDSTRIHPLAGNTALGISLGASLPTLPAWVPRAEVRVVASLRRPPAADTQVVLGDGNYVAVADGIGPRPVLATIVENTLPGIDTLKVRFSEPVTYAGATLPFRSFLGGVETTPAVALPAQVHAGNGTSELVFVVQGNTAGTIAEGVRIAISTASGLIDASGNQGRYGDCGSDTAQVALQPIAVPILDTWMSDRDGDGKADVVTIVFRREFRKPAEAPDKIVVGSWLQTTDITVPWTSAVSVGTATYQVPVDVALGLTVGTARNGMGRLTLLQGAMRKEDYDLRDSVPPIAIGTAKLEYATAATDRLTVRFSEHVKADIQAGSTVVLVRKTPAGDEPLSVISSSIPSDLVGANQGTFDVPAGLVQPGDLIRMAVVGSALRAVSSSQLPASSGAAPYVPVVGGDRAPDSAWVLDRNGDGNADAVRLVWKRPLLGSPVFSFQWAGASIEMDSVAYAKRLVGLTEVILPVAGFPAGITSGQGTGASISVIEGTRVAPLPFILLDGMAPVLKSIFVSYGQVEGAADTIALVLSEPLKGPALPTFLLDILRRGEQKAFLPRDLGAFIIGSGERLLVICDSCTDGVTTFGLPAFGDSGRLSKGLSDADGNLVGDLSLRVPVLTGPYPIRYKASIFPRPVFEDTLDSKITDALPPLTVWVLPTSLTGQARPLSSTGNSGLQTLTMADVGAGLFGVRVELNTSFDGQVLAYDNLGVFVGKLELKIDRDSLDAAGMVQGNGKYTILLSLNGMGGEKGRLASGVYMLRLVSYSQQSVNGQDVRVMIQNKLFKVGYKRKQ